MRGDDPRKSDATERLIGVNGAKFGPIRGEDRPGIYGRRSNGGVMRAIALALVLTLVAALVGVAPLGAAGSGAADAVGEPETNATAGEQLSGAIGVQQAEIDGEVEERAFGLAVAEADDEARADAVVERANVTEERLDELEERADRLEAKHDNGTITRGQYEARMARLAAESASAERAANDSATVAEDLPAELVAERGADPAAIETLRERASELSGPEVAAIARSIAGPGAGEGVGPDHAQRGPPMNETPGAGPNGPPANDTGGADPGGPPGNDTGGPPTDDTGGPPSDDTGGPPG